MRKKKLVKKWTSGILSAALALSLLPVSALAVTGDQVAADGTYTGTAQTGEVTNKSVAHDYVEEDEDYNYWKDYTITATVVVDNGVFSSIAFEYGSTFQSSSRSYYNDAISGADGIATKLTGQAATADTVNAWDSVSGATYTSDTAKEALIAALTTANEAEEVTVDKTELTSLIAAAQALDEDDYASGWDALQTALTSAQAAADSTAATQDEVDAAAKALENAINALVEVTKYITMNVPYTDFYAAYNLTDAAIWEVADGIDAVSTATTSKFLGTTGLAKGTYNDGTYILGVTLPVAVSASDYKKLNADLSSGSNYYYVDLSDTPTAYSTLTIDDNGDYSFSKLADAAISTDYLSVDELDLTGGYGDYQVSLVGFDTSNGIRTGESTYISDYTIYGAILNTSSGTYGMTALENLWYGTRVENVEIAWSIEEGQQLHRAHGSGGLFYQFSGMNGATLNSVTVITSLGLIKVSAANGGIELTKYYDGDTSALTVAITNNSDAMTISGIPSDLEDVAITVDDLVTNGSVEDGEVQLDAYPEDGVQYTVTISSSNYPDITTTVSTPISALQIAELEKWMALAEAADGYDSNSDLQEHVAEAEELIADADATSYGAATLIDELISKVKATYTETVAAEASLKGSVLEITLSGAGYADLENPTYTLSSRSGRNTVTLTSGSLTGLKVLLDTAPTEGTSYTLTIVSDNYADITASVTAEAAESTTYKYVTMNVPYTDFYAAYALTDAAVWEVEDGLDAVSTATTSKFKGTTGLANGTYNDGTYILGVTLAVAVSEEDYADLSAKLTENDNYYFADLTEKPEIYSTLLIDSEGNYSFSKYQTSTVGTEYLSVGEYTFTDSYGDYQIDLDGVGTDKTIKTGASDEDTVSYNAIYGAILTTTDGGSYGMTALENLWYGTRVENVEIAWSIEEGRQLQRAHGSGGLFYQFENMNGATLNSVILITDLGIITIDCNQKLTEYYDGDLSGLTASIANNSLDMAISGIPSEFEDVTVTVDELTETEKEVTSAITTAAEDTAVSGTVALDSYPEDGIQYTVTISSSNYPDVTTTVSTPISALQIAELEKWMALAKAADGYDSKSELQDHVAEAEELIADADATSYDAATLIDELISKVKATYSETVTAEASLSGSILEIKLTGADYTDLKNPTYTLSYSSGRSTTTLTSGSLTGLKILLDAEPTEEKSYTLTIVSDNYQDITASVTAAAAEATTYKYVTMNVPYTDFYAVYGLTDAAVWEVEDGIDAVSTATTSKFTGTTGLANGTYNDGTYIRGVTLAVAVSETDYAKLSKNLTENDNYYFADLTEEPAIYSTLLIDSEGNYSFSKYQTSTVGTEYLSVGKYTITDSYGDYQIDLVGVGTNKTIKTGASDEDTVSYNAIYGAILTTTDGGSYGMTALENLWYGTRVENVEIAWSIEEGRQLQRAHGSGGLFYQFENMNGATLNSVILITDLGLITIDCMQQLDEYYDGDLELSASIANNSLVMNISGIPDELEDVRVTVDGLTNEKKELKTGVYTVAAQGTTKSGTVALDSYPEDGVLYTVTISSSNYPSITTTASTPITTEQKEELQKWINAAKALNEYASRTDLQDHVKEAEAMIANTAATSAEAADLIEELMGMVKACYPTATATATLEGVYLAVTLDPIELKDLINPTYTLTYRSGRNTLTLISGDLDSLRKRLQVTPEVGTEYTLTIVSDNYQDITTTVTAAAATVDTSALETAIASAEALTESNYTAESWAALTTALTAAKEALEAGESQTAIDTATANLNAAMSALSAAADTVDTSALAAAIAKAEALTQSDYTADSWTALQTALAAAKAALTADNQSTVDQAAQALNAAIDGLVPATTSLVSDTTSDTASDNSNIDAGTVTSDSSSDSSSSAADTSSSASTGDNMNLWIWMLVILIAAAAAGVTVRRRKETR